MQFDGTDSNLDVSRINCILEIAVVRELELLQNLFLILFELDSSS
jgi:hypothetical protein